MSQSYMCFVMAACNLISSIYFDFGCLAFGFVFAVWTIVLLIRVYWILQDPTLL